MNSLNNHSGIDNRVLDEPDKKLAELARLASQEHPNLKPYSQDPDPSIQMLAAEVLATRIINGEQDRFEELKAMLNTEHRDVLFHVMLQLGGLQDSRALWPLVNIHESRNLGKDYARIKEMAKLAIVHSGDPRAEQFLKDRGYDYDASDVARNEYTYTYRGPASILDRLPPLPEHIATIDSEEDLERLIPHMEYMERIGHPLTYVVDTEYQMRIGVEVEEHVIVAQGEDVLAAGEIEFERPFLGVQMVNNRSIGYLPDRTRSFHAVKEALAFLDLPNGYTDPWPEDYFSEDLRQIFDADTYDFKPVWQ